MDRYKSMLTFLLLLVLAGCSQASTSTECAQTPVAKPTISFTSDIHSADTLHFYLTKSELVVAGTVASEPMVVTIAKGESNYIVTFHIEEIIYGPVLPETEINVNIIRLEENPGEAGQQYLQQGFRCILFLKKQPTGYIPEWETSDDWFGVQFYNSIMITILKRLSSQ